jgi:hypothetical protein
MKTFKEFLAETIGKKVTNKAVISALHDGGVSKADMRSKLDGYGVHHYVNPSDDDNPYNRSASGPTHHEVTYWSNSKEGSHAGLKKISDHLNKIGMKHELQLKDKKEGQRGSRILIPHRS